MADITIALKDTLEHEGGFVDDPDDRGGATNYGITEIVARRHGYDGHMRDLPKETAIAIYKKDYWDPIMLDDCPDQDIANELFDTAVNQGTRTASKYLQRCLNLLNRDQRDYPDIKVDGRVGPITIYTLKMALSKGVRWKTGLLKCLNGEQYMRYRALSLFSSKQEKFMHGWLKRVTFQI